MNPVGKSKRCLAKGWPAVWLLLQLAWLAPLGFGREVPVMILHTADIHGHVAAVKSDRGQEPGGGFLRCAARIAEIRRAEPNVILVDCGDLIQGAPESCLTRNGIIRDAVRYLRYDALVPGNHEFDGGVEALRVFYAEAGVPVIAANIHSDKHSPALPGALPFLCREVNGVRVAIVGLTTPHIPTWSRPQLLGDLSFETSVSALRRVMPQVRAQRPDILVLAAHQGWRRWGDDPANEINAIARAFPEFDLILGAHTHQAIEHETVHGAAYTQAECYGLWLGAARLVFDTDARRIKSKRIQLLSVDSGVAPDKALEALTAPALRATESYLDEEVGVAAVELKPTSRYKGQSAVQALIAAAIAERVQAEVVIHRALTEASLRSGRIAMRDIWRIAPYENYIGVAQLTMEELREILEENSGYYTSREFRGVHGLTYDLATGAPPGARVSNIRLSGGGEARGAGERVRVAFNSYDMASAGGRFPRLRSIVDRPTSLLKEYRLEDTRTAVVEYIRRHRPLDVKAVPGARPVMHPDLDRKPRSTPAATAEPRSTPAATAEPRSTPAATSEAGNPVVAAHVGRGFID